MEDDLLEVLDTNVIVRHLTQDDADHARRARAVFADVESRRRTVSLGEGVLVETVQVLSSKNLYNLARQEIRHHLTRLLAMPGVEIPHKGTYVRSFDLYVAHPPLSFVDCLCIAHAERQGNIDILSFDRAFDRASIQADTAIRRAEP